MTGVEFRKIRESLGMTQETYSNEIGITIRQISRIETGISSVRDYQEKLILSLSKRLNKTIDNIINIPIYDVSASAGSGMINNENITEVLSIDKDSLRSLFNLNFFSNLSIITARGDSMVPTIPENSRVLIQKQEVREGQVCVCRIGDELYIKRLQKLPKLRLISDNKAYEPIELSEQMEYEIVGVVIGYFKGV